MEAVEIDVKEELLDEPNYELFGTFENPESTIKGLTREVMKDIEFKTITVDTENRLLIITTNKRKFNPLKFKIAGTNGGVAEEGEGRQGDGKMPKGEFTIHGARLPQDDPMEEMFTLYREEQISYGPAFIYLDAPDENGKRRGIGFHGSNENVDRNTNGCIRLFNDDLLLIQDKLTIGVKVNII